LENNNPDTFLLQRLERDYMLREPEKRIEAGNILVQNNKSDDLKLFEVFQIYKDDIQKECSQLYYALLAWKDSHLKELLTEQNKQK
jgi:hypothetical protein